MYRKNTAGQFVGFQLILTATGAVGVGLTVSVRRCIDGVFAAGGGTVTEDKYPSPDVGTSGGYKYAMSQADTNGNNVTLWFSATGAIPVCINFVTTAADPTDGVRLGLTALPNAAAGATGGLPTGDNTGKVALQADQAVNASKIGGQTVTAAAGITVPSEIASPTNITGGTITTVTNLTNLPSIPTNWITAAGINSGALNDKGNWNIGKTGYSLTQTFPTNFSALAISVGGDVTFGNTSIGTVTTLTNLPSIPTNWITAAGINANALDNKGNWNVGKTGYSLTQTFPTNFSALAIDLAGAVTYNNTVTISGTVSADVTQWKGATAPAMTGDAFARIGAAGAGLTALGDTRIANLDGTISGATSTITAAIPTAVANADALLDRTAGVETNRTPRQAFRLMLAALAGKASGLETALAKYRDTNDTKDRISAVVDADGNRSVVTYDMS